MNCGLTWHDDTGYEWRCSVCRASWPLAETAIWRDSLRRCGACKAEGRPLPSEAVALKRTAGDYTMRCGRCAADVPLDGYYRGRYSLCRRCTLDDQRAYRQSHPESPERLAAKRLYSAMYRRYKPGYVAAYSKRWRAKNRDHVIAWQRAYYAERQPHMRELARENYQRHAEEYREAARRRYHSRTPEEQEAFLAARRERRRARAA